MCTIRYMSLYMENIYMKTLQLPHVHGIKPKALQKYTPNM